MGWKQWAAVCAVIGIGILYQIPSHHNAEMDHVSMPSMAEPAGPFTTVALEVTGMT